MSKQKNIKTILIAAGIVVVMAVVAVVAYSLEGKMSEAGANEDSYEGSSKEWKEDWQGSLLTFGDQTYRVQDRCETFLLAGTDLSGEEGSQGEEYAGSLADFLALYVVNHTDHTYAVLPIDRNTMVDVPMLNRAADPEDTYYEQICTSHWYGSNRWQSCENTAGCVSSYLGGLPIDGYYFISMTQIPAINHALGGVTVTLTDDFTDSDPEMEKGKSLKLSDEQAEIFVRSRMSMDDDANSKRMSRQRVYFTAAMKQIRARLKEDSNYVNNLYDSFDKVADTTIKSKQLSRAINAFISYKDKGILEIQGETKLGDTFKDGVSHEEFYPDSQSVLEIMNQIYTLTPEEEG